MVYVMETEPTAGAFTRDPLYGFLTFFVAEDNTIYLMGSAEDEELVTTTGAIYTYETEN